MRALCRSRRSTRSVINVGCGKEANGNSKVIEAIVRDVTGDFAAKPIITHAKKSIANPKREGMPVGAMLPLRHDRMWEFLDRLFNVVSCRVFATSAWH